MRELNRADPEGAVAEAAKRCSNWGRWGADDVLGTLNFLDDAKRRQGAALVRRGASFSLAQSFDAAVAWRDGIRLLPPLTPPTVRDFVTFEEHVEGVRRSVDGAGGVPPEWYEAPTFYRVVAGIELPPVRPARPRPRIRKRTP